MSFCWCKHINMEIWFRKNDYCYVLIFLSSIFSFCIQSTFASMTFIFIAECLWCIPMTFFCRSNNNNRIIVNLSRRFNKIIIAPGIHFLFVKINSIFVHKFARFCIYNNSFIKLNAIMILNFRYYSLTSLCKYTHSNIKIKIKLWLNTCFVTLKLTTFI